MTTARRKRTAVTPDVEMARPDAGHHSPGESHRPPPNVDAPPHAPAPHNNLSLPRSSLIGRDHEVAVIQQLLLQEQVGLLTLTGPGGIGKTRLAMQVAANLLDHFVDGVYFVALAPIRDPDLVGAAIAQTLGLHEAAGRPLQESLQDYLRDRQLLLVLDNFEQILAAAPLVSVLLTLCQRVKILVTSRATLHLYGEQEFPVPPLALPDAKQPTANLSEFAAIDLFCQRAKAVKPDFALTPANAADVAKICIGLDGLPLAIELAAARLKLFSPSALLVRLNQRLTLLAGGSHDLPTRQRTLRDEIAWSYDLLTADEQTLFRRLAVFAGGFTLEAAQAVGNRNGDLGIDGLSGVATLVDHNLLKKVEQGNGDARFDMLETIQEYSLEQLEASGEVETVRRQHANFFLSLAEEADPKLRGPEQLSWLQRLEMDYANLQAALAWSLREGEQVDSRDREQGLRLAGSLHWFCNIRSYFNAARHWCDRALALADAVDNGPARARALQGAGVAAQMQSDFAYARIRLEESLSLWRELEDRWGIAYTQGWLAWVASVPGDHVTGRSLAEASLALFREIRDSWGIAWMLDTLGAILCKLGDYGTARSLLEESVMRYQVLGDTWGIIDALGELSGVTFSQGDYKATSALIEEQQAVLATQPLIDDKFVKAGNLNALGIIARLQADQQAAANHFAQSLDAARAAGVQWFVALACQQLGLIAQQQGEALQARQHLRASLELSWALGRTEKLLSLIGCIAVAVHQQQWEQAARLGGAVDALCASLERPFTSWQEADYERCTSPIRARRNELWVAEAWAQGQSMALEEAVTYALTLLNAPVFAASTVESSPVLPPPKSYPADLTEREIEVLRLLAQRLTYAEIADKLVISRRTVNAHVTSIYSKLDVTSREAATHFALEHHLL